MGRRRRRRRRTIRAPLFAHVSGALSLHHRRARIPPTVGRRGERSAEDGEETERAEKQRARLYIYERSAGGRNERGPALGLRPLDSCRLAPPIQLARGRQRRPSVRQRGGTAHERSRYTRVGVVVACETSGAARVRDLRGTSTRRGASLAQPTDPVFDACLLRSSRLTSARFSGASLRSPSTSLPPPPPSTPCPSASKRFHCPLRRSWYFFTCVYQLLF